MHAHLQAEMRIYTALSRGQSPVQRVALHAHAINMQIDAGVRSQAQDGDNNEPIIFLSRQVPQIYSDIAYRGCHVVSDLSMSTHSIQESTS